MANLRTSGKQAEVIAEPSCDEPGVLRAPLLSADVLGNLANVVNRSLR